MGERRAEVARGQGRSIAAVGGLKAYYLVGQAVVVVLLARSMGTSGFGVYAVSLAVVQVLLGFALLSFPSWLVRETAILARRGRMGRARAVARSSACGVLASSSIGVGCLALIAWPGWLPWLVVAYGSSIIVTSAVSSVLTASIRGAGRVVRSQVPDEVVRVTILLLGVVVFTVTHEQTSLGQALGAVLAASVGSLLCAWLQWRATFRGIAYEGRVKTHRTIRASLDYFALSVAQILTYHLGVVVAGIALGPDAAGIYRVAVQVTDGMMVGLYAISIVISPRIASHQGDHGAVGHIVVKAHRLALAMMALLAVIVLPSSALVVETVFGSEYGAAVPALVVLLVGQLVNAPVAFAGLASNMLGYPRVALVATCAVLVALVPCTYSLSTGFGPVGTSTATAGSLLLVNLVQIAWLKKLTRRNLSAFGRADH